MPEPTVNQEAVQRAALVKEGVGVLPSSSAEVRRHESMYRTQMAKMPGGETSANLSQVLEAQTGVTAQNGENALEANIGTQVDKNGKKTRTEPGVGERHDAAKKAEELSRRLSREPYIKLDADQQIAVRAQFDEVIDVTALSGLDKTSRDALFNDIIKDPEFLHLLRTEYGTVTRKRLGDRITEAQRKLDETSAKERLAKAKRDRLKRELKGKKEAMASFEKGDDSKEMVNLATSPADARRLENELSSKQSELETLRALIRVNKAGQDPAGDQRTLNDAIVRIKGELDTAQTNAAKYAALKEGKSALPGKISELETQLDEAEEAFQQATGDKGAAEADITSAKSRRVDDEKEWIGQLENLPRTAMAHYVEGKIGRANQAAAESLLNDGKESGDVVEKGMEKYARTRYHKYHKPTFWNKSPVEPNRRMVMLEMNRLMDPSVGADVIVADAIASTLGITDREDPKFVEKMADKDFVSKWEAKYAQQIVGSYVRIGGKVTPDMYEYISSQPWGESLVENAIAKNEGIRAVEDKLKASGQLGPDGLAGYLKTKKKTIGVAVLAALLSGIFGGVPGVIGGAIAAGELPGIIGAAGVAATAGSMAVDAGKASYGQRP